MAEKKTLSRALRLKSWWRWQMCNQMSLAYDRAYVNGWTAGAAVALEHLYEGRKDDLRAALQRTRDYWLCEQTFGSIVYGIYLSMEEEYANGADFDPEMIRTVKSSLMGPVSGMGDSIMGSTIRQIITLFFLSYAMEGATWAPISYYLFYTFVVCTPLFLIFLENGYKLGRNAITKLIGTPWLKAITKACSVAAMVIMGAMTCKYASFALKLTFEREIGTVDVGAQIENGLPGFLVLGATFIYYWLVGKKVNYILIILGTFLLCLVLSLLGIA